MSEINTMDFCYDLNGIGDDKFTDIYYKEQSQLTDEYMNAMLSKHHLKYKKWIHNQDVYNILRYDKEKLSSDKYHTEGLFRSVIYRNGNIKCIAPPKSIEYNLAITLPEFSEESISSKNVIAEEFVEGTMINIFWDEDWQIATRSSVGGNVSFFTTDKTLKTNTENTFKWMFLDAVNYLENTSETNEELFTFLNNIPKNVCLSFVLQHPKNRIVVPFTAPALYLVAAYEVQNFIVNALDIYSNKFRSLLPSFIKYPLVYDFNNYNDLMNMFASENTDYKTVGVMIKDIKSGLRTKLRNPNYEMVRQLRGNQPKLQFRYLTLRSEQKVTEYLKYFPEHSKIFNKYRQQVHEFTNNLYTNYISCYIKKQKPLKEFPDEYRTNMFKLHEHYIQHLMDNKKYINKKEVVEYVNKMPVTVLMHSINYKAHHASS